MVRMPATPEEKRGREKGRCRRDRCSERTRKREREREIYIYKEDGEREKVRETRGLQNHEEGRRTFE